MLTLSIVSPEQGAFYYSKENYYSKDDGYNNSFWHGKLKKKFGLNKQVSNDTFIPLLNSINPESTETIVNRNAVNKIHKIRAGIDLTFSAPKSVTIDRKSVV